MNNVALIGRLTRDVEVRYSQNRNGDDSVVARFNLAVDNPFNKENPSFINIVTFGSTAEFCEKYLSKGIRIGVTGRIQTGSYVNQDDITIYTTDVIATQVFFADGVKEDKQENTSRSNSNSRNNSNSRSNTGSKGGNKSNSKK